MASGCSLIFDEEMTRYKLLWTEPACEVEVPERLTVCRDALTAHALTERCRRVPVRQATEQEILLVHSEEYLEAVKQTPKMTLEDLMTFTKNYNDVYFHPNIYHCAKLAAGAALQLVDGVMKKEVRNGMALVRPPGHHSQRSAANGFCVFNNVAIAALYARKNYNLNRILIVDWDIHHGQGVQFCFEEDPSVLYFSWHRYEHQAFWPNLPESDYTSVGKGKGSGFNVNLPWNKVGMTNSDYLAAFFHVLLPIAYEFDPELVLVSAGFDSAIGDPEGRMVATPEIFAHLTQLLMPLAGGRMCAVLEGGYNLISLPQSVCQTVQTLLGDPAPELSGLSDACESALESIQNVRRAHSSYWSCFKHADTTSEANSKRLKLQENNSKVTEEEKPSAETESMEPEDIVWPKPVPRPSPAVCTVVALPSGAEVSLPDGCLPLGEISQTVIEEAQKIWDKHFQDVKDETNLKHVGNIISVLDQMKNKEVRNGCVVVSDLSVSVLCALQHTLTHLTERVLVVFIGDEKLPVDTSDGKILLVQICGEESEEEKCVNRMSLRLKEGEGFKAGFIHSVLGLLLPLAYEFNPGLVLGVVGVGNGKSHLPPVWGHLTSLLQGLAQGRTLALQQGYDKDLMAVTVTALSGGPVSPLGAQEALRSEDVEMMEKQRCRMQKRWGLLRCTVSES